MTVFRNSQNFMTANALNAAANSGLSGPLSEAIERAASGSGDAGLKRQAMVALLGNNLAAARSNAEKALLTDKDGLACVHLLSETMDDSIRALFNAAIKYLYRADNPSTSERLSIVAVGGYGRGTLAPG